MIWFMTQSYRKISARLARQIKLVMTDVDGTVAPGGEPPGLAVAQAVRRLEKRGIGVGLVSGRTLPELDKMAHDLAITGPIIAENGGVARLKVDAPLVDLGYSRQPALDALKKLKTLYPGSIREREDNKDRIIDVVFFADGIKPAEIRRQIGDVQFLDSGYVLHLMQPGISKGKTLKTLLGLLPDKGLSADNVIIFGDSLTDASLFELFPHCVLVPNPLLDAAHRKQLEGLTEYVSDGGVGEGFVEVVNHILDKR